MKKITAFLLSLILLTCMTFPASATGTLPRLSDMTDIECLEFVKNHGVEIPNDYEDETRWAPFVKQTILQVEANPNCHFNYNYTVTQNFAKAIQQVVNEYYGLSPSRSLSNLETASVAYYRLQDSTPLGNWDSSYTQYNCYAYSIGRTDSFYNPGDFSGTTFSLSTSLSEQVNAIIADLEHLGYGCVVVTDTCPSYSCRYDGYNAICYRYGSSDFHFMKMDSSYWSHKPSWTQPLKYNYLPSNTRTWSNENVRYNTHYSGNIIYDSDIAFITYAIECAIEYTFVGSGSHTEECQYCGNSKRSLCITGNVYCGSTDIGDFHRLECVECGHLYDTEIYDCTYIWSYYGTYNGVNCHAKKCSACGHENGTPQPCQYSTPGMCDYCG